MLKDKISRFGQTGNFVKIQGIGGSCGSVSKYYGDTFNLSITYEYQLDIAKDLTFVIFIDGVAHGDSGAITKSGSGTSTVSITTLPISLSPGTYDVDIKLYMGDVDSGSGGLADSYTCTSGLTVLAVESADITGASISG